MKITHIIVAASFAMASSVASAATIWAPTNEDTDFIQLDFAGTPVAGPGISTNGGTLALFDESDFGGNALVIGEDGGQVVITDNNNGSWNAEFFDKNDTSGGSITLLDNANFMLGMDWGMGYVGDSNATLVSSPDTYLIVFHGYDNPDNHITANTLAVDLAPIPVPAAVWLFGTGLIGLVAVARRKKV